MGTIKNFRTTADVTMNTRLKDGGIYIDWAGLTDIRAWIYSDAQKALAGRVDVTIDQQDSTKAVLVYAGTKAQYPGINRLIVQARYNGSLKTYDKAVFNFVPRTAEATGNVTIDEPETDVEIVVQDVSSSILDATILAALAAADRANEAAEAAEHMVDIHTGPQGPAGKSPYIDETTGHWFIYDDETGEYVDSGNVAKGDTGNGIASWTVVESQEDGGSNVVTVVFTNGDSESFTVKNGNTGATPNLTIGTVETGAAGSQAEATITGTAANPVLNLRIPQGVPGVVQAKYVEVDTLPTASASTMNALYLVPSQVQGSYDIYYTSQDGRETYSWVFLCGTTIQLSDYATKAEVDQLEQKVDDISTGKYYGYYATSSDLPDDATVDGFAYVGSGPTYTIYNCEGGVWTSSGITVNQSPVGNDDDIDQNADGKLQFANRVYNSLQPDGMGYKILRKDATFASQVTDTNTIYEIRYDFVLSANFTMPAGCVLRFNGGSISGAYTLTGNLTGIEATLVQIFDTNVLFGGTWNVDESFPEWFGGGTLNDDAPAILSSIKLAKTTILSREYTIASEMALNSMSNKAIVGKEGNLLKGVSGNKTTFFYGIYCNNISFVGLNFNGQRPTTLAWVWPHEMNGAIIFGTQCSDITIKDCRFEAMWYGVCPSGGRGKNAIIEGCKFIGNNTDIDTYALPGLNIQNNISDGCTDNSIQVEPIDAAQGDIEDYTDYLNNAISVCNQVVNNTILNCAKNAITIHGGSYNTIVSNNNIYNFTHGIYIKENAYGVRVVGNIIKNCIAPENTDANSRPGSDHFAAIIEAAGTVFSDNLIIYPETGISVRSAKDVVIKNNVIRKCKHTGFVLYGDLSGLMMEGNIVEGTYLSANGWWGQCAIFTSSLSSNITIRNCRFDATAASTSHYHAIYLYNQTGILNIDSCEFLVYAKPVDGNASLYVVSDSHSMYGIGITSARPTITNVRKGFIYFDETLGKCIVSNGSAWVNMDGSALS